MNEKNVKNILIVLVETETPGNLGASARAMKAMGLKALRLVNPKRKDSREARARAVHAYDVLEQAEVFTTLEAALADCHYVLGTSGQIESLDLPQFTSRQFTEFLQQDIELLHHKIAIVFGRESTGLSKAELSLCHSHIKIPTHQDCPSLNLAAAVQIICYELASMKTTKNLQDKQNREDADFHHNSLRVLNNTNHSHNSQKKVDLASKQQLDYLLGQLEALAVEVGSLDPQHPRQFSRRLRELYQRAIPRKAELSLMQSICKRALTKLSKKEKL